MAIDDRRAEVKANAPQIKQNLKQGYLDQGGGPIGGAATAPTTWKGAVEQFGANPQVQQAMSATGVKKPLRAAMAAPGQMSELMGSTGPVDKNVLKQMWR